MFADPQDSFDLNGDFFLKIIPNIFGNSPNICNLAEQTNKQLEIMTNTDKKTLNVNYRQKAIDLLEDLEIEAFNYSKNSGYYDGVSFSSLSESEQIDVLETLFKNKAIE